MKENVRELFLSTTGYLYEEPFFLLRQELQEPGVYSTIIEAVASGASRAHEIAAKAGENSAKCLKYMKTLRELEIIEKETPFGEKAGDTPKEGTPAEAKGAPFLVEADAKEPQSF